MQKNDNSTALQSMQGILHITALQPCEFLPLLKTFFHSAMGTPIGNLTVTLASDW